MLFELLQFPDVERGKAFCGSVWRVESAEVVTRSHLSATIHNKGEVSNYGTCI